MPRKSRDVKSTAPSPSPARVTRASRSRTAEDRDEVASVATQPTVPEEDEEEDEEDAEEQEEQAEEVVEDDTEAADEEGEAAEEDGEEKAPAKASREERMTKLKELRMRMVSRSQAGSLVGANGRTSRRPRTAATSSRTTKSPR